MLTASKWSAGIGLALLIIGLIAARLSNGRGVTDMMAVAFFALLGGAALCLLAVVLLAVTAVWK
jgi:hypothetical protein